MKKMLLALLLLLPASVKADLGDQIKATLVDHVDAVAQFDAQGTTRASLLDSVIQIGNYNGHSILDIQAGFSGNTRPDPSDASAINYLAGAVFRLDPFFKSRVNLPAEWEFLKSLEFGIGYHYDFREHHPFVNFQVGLAFDPSPIQ